jgi:hypothetical protein
MTLTELHEWLFQINQVIGPTQRFGVEEYGNRGFLTIEVDCSNVACLGIGRFREKDSLQVTA